MGGEELLEAGHAADILGWRTAGTVDEARLIERRIGGDGGLDDVSPHKSAKNSGHFRASRLVPRRLHNDPNSQFVSLRRRIRTVRS